MVGQFQLSDSLNQKILVAKEKLGTVSDLSNSISFTLPEMFSDGCCPETFAVIFSPALGT
jgi:hypothetical protein